LLACGVGEGERVAFEHGWDGVGERLGEEGETWHGWCCVAVLVVLVCTADEGAGRGAGGPLRVAFARGMRVEDFACLSTVAGKAITSTVHTPPLPPTLPAIVAQGTCELLTQHALVSWETHTRIALALSVGALVQASGFVTRQSDVTQLALTSPLPTDAVVGTFDWGGRWGVEEREGGGGVGRRR
jgi:hypothetical protein